MCATCSTTRRQPDTPIEVLVWAESARLAGRELASPEVGTARLRQGCDGAHLLAHLLKLACLLKPATWVQVLARAWPRGTKNLIAAASACRKTHTPVGQRLATRAIAGPLWWRACAARAVASDAANCGQHCCKRSSGAPQPFSAPEHIYITFDLHGGRSRSDYRRL